MVSLHVMAEYYKNLPDIRGQPIVLEISVENVSAAMIGDNCCRARMLLAESRSKDKATD